MQEYETDKRSACGKFLGQVEKKLRSVTFTAPSFYELRSVYLARELYLPSSKEEEFTEEEINELYKRFFQGYKAIKEEPDVKKLFNDVHEYGRELKALGIRDSQIYESHFKTMKILKKIGISLFRLMMSLLLVLPGLITLLPLGYVNRVLAEKERVRALNKSSVKAVAADVMASTKMLSTMILYPLTCSVFMTLFFLFQWFYTDLKFTQIFSNCLWFLVVYPLYNYLCVRSLDGVIDNFNNLRSRILCLMSKDRMEKIKKKRSILAHKVHETINTYGPKVFQNFDKMKLVKGLKKRKNKDIVEKEDSDNESSQTSFKSYFMIDEMDFDDAFKALTELGL